MLHYLQQNPIFVEVGRQTAPAHDISIDVVLGIFAMAGAFLLAAAIGSVLVAAGMLLFKRWRDSSSSSGEAPEPTHTRLRI